LIIGAGSLGGRVGARWRERYPDATVLAETRSPTRHANLRAAGMQVRTREEPPPAAFPNVLCSVPASQPDYAAECARAVELWNGRGTLVITSSTAVYAESQGHRCAEDSALATNDRAQRLLTAERAVVDAGGAVVRLAGLYDENRGPHRVYLRQAESARRPDGLVNLVHYDDAAELCALALETGEPRGVYMGCDNAPITRADLASAAASAERKRTAAREVRACSFTGTDGPIGRRCDSTETRRRLGWLPRHASFLDWAAAH